MKMPLCLWISLHCTWAAAKKHTLAALYDLQDRISKATGYLILSTSSPFPLLTTQQIQGNISLPIPAKDMNSDGITQKGY